MKGGQNLANAFSEEEYRTRTYEELSTEFQQLYPKAIRAYQLIPLMYNRLTLVDNFSHKQARRKIINDHQYLPGFSDRNVRRYFPENNPVVPHRIRPPRPKNDYAKDGSTGTVLNVPNQNSDESPYEPVVNTNNFELENIISKLSTPDASFNDNDPKRSLLQVEPKEKEISQSLNECANCQELSAKVADLNEALLKATALSTADKIPASSISSSGLSNNNNLSTKVNRVPFLR